MHGAFDFTDFAQWCSCVLLAPLHSLRVARACGTACARVLYIGAVQWQLTVVLRIAMYQLAAYMPVDIAANTFLPLLVGLLQRCGALCFSAPTYILPVMLGGIMSITSASEYPFEYRLSKPVPL